MSTDTTRRTVGQFLAARASGDQDAVIALLSPEVELRPPRSTGFGPFHGPDAVAVALAGAVVGEVLRVDTIERTLHHVLADGDIGVVLNRLEATARTGQPYENEYCFVIRCEDGRIVRIDEFTDTLRADAVFHFADL